MLVKTFSSGTVDVNCYVAADQDTRQAVIIDPGYYHPLLVKFVKDQQLKPELILLTHGHGDHLCGVPSYRKKYPCIQVLAHRADEYLFANSAINFSEEVSGRPLTIRPDRFVADGDVLELGRLRLVVLHTPGHTSGSISILAENYLFSGDTLFRKAIGRSDYPGGSNELLRRSVREKLFTLPDSTLVLPGHMKPTTIGYEKENNPFFI